MTKHVTRSSTGERPKFWVAPTDRTERPIESRVRVLYRTQSDTAQWFAFPVALTGGAERPVQSEWADVPYRVQPETGQRFHLAVQAFQELMKSWEGEAASQVSGGWSFLLQEDPSPLSDACLAEARTAFVPSSAFFSSHVLSDFRTLDARPSKAEPGGGVRTVEGRLEHLLERLFQAARDEYFEDGMESSLSKGLAPMVENYGNTDDLRELLAYWILRDKATPYVVCEALRCLGRITHAPSHRYRRWLLERCLKSPSAIIRDAAGVGLAYLDDPQSILALAEAVQKESDPELQGNLSQVLKQFRR